MTRLRLLVLLAALAACGTHDAARPLAEAGRPGTASHVVARADAEDDVALAALAAVSGEDSVAAADLAAEDDAGTRELAAEDDTGTRELAAENDAVTPELADADVLTPELAEPADTNDSRTLGTAVSLLGLAVTLGATVAPYLLF